MFQISCIVSKNCGHCQLEAVFRGEKIMIGF